MTTMSNLEDTDSASSASTFVEMAHVKPEEMPNVTVEHLEMLCQGHVSRALIVWAMVGPDRKLNFIQAVKHSMAKNNLWMHSQETFMKELAHSVADDNCGNTESLFWFSIFSVAKSDC